MLIVKKFLGFLRRKTLNHTRNILRITLYVNNITRSWALGVAALGGACPGPVGEDGVFAISPPNCPPPRFFPAHATACPFRRRFFAEIVSLDRPLQLL